MNKNRLRRLRGMITQILCVSLVAGCGYTTRSMISSDYKTIYIPPFVNKIVITQEADTGSKYQLFRPMLDTDITRKIIDKYIFDGNLKVVPEGSSDVVLKGELIGFRKDPLRYNDSQQVMEYRVNIVVNLKLVNAKTGNTIWEENGFTGDSTYFTANSTARTPQTEDSAITAAIDDLARRVIERTIENW